MVTSVFNTVIGLLLTVKTSCPISGHPAVVCPAQPDRGLLPQFPHHLKSALILK